MDNGQELVNALIRGIRIKENFESDEQVIIYLAMEHIRLLEYDAVDITTHATQGCPVAEPYVYEGDLLMGDL